MARPGPLGQNTADLYNSRFNFFCSFILYFIFRRAGVSNHIRVNPISFASMDKRSRETYFFINHIVYFFLGHLSSVCKIYACSSARRADAGDTLIWKTFF